MASKTLSQYINEVSIDFFNLRKVSKLEVIDGFEVLQRISIEPYIDTLKSNAILVSLNPGDVSRYKFKPRLLAREVYGSENLFYLILMLNDMIVETFVPEQIYLLNRSDRSIVEDIINKERQQGRLS